jgi:osmotically-inducible protein OsmY
MSTHLHRVAAPLLVSLTLAACVAATPTRESTGETFDSAWITTQVKSKLLADPATSAMKISVDTFRNVVTLTGFATSSEAKRTLEIVRSVPGVKEVRNNLLIRD